MSEDAMRLVLHLILSGSALGVLPACSDSARDTQPTAPDRPPVVVALGDSLTAGFGLAPDEAYPALLQSRIERADYPHRVINAGVSGDTSAGALRRLDSVLHADTRVLILAIGANDGLQGAPIAELRANLTTIIERARARNVRILLCGMETPPTRGFDYTLAFHGVFPELASRYQTALMPFLLEGVVGDPALNLPDRFHPNAAGYRRIAERMWPYLEPLLRATSSTSSTEELRPPAPPVAGARGYALISRYDSDGQPFGRHLSAAVRSFPLVPSACNSGRAIG